MADTGPNDVGVGIEGVFPSDYKPFYLLDIPYSAYNYP